MPEVRDAGAARRLVRWSARLALGDESSQRITLVRTLTAAAVYVLCVAMQWSAALFGFTTAGKAAFLTAFCLTGAFGFVIAIRAGFMRHVDVQKLTMAQMVFAILCCNLAYHTNPQLRGTLPIIAALVLVFGAFTLSASRCVRLGKFAIASFAVTMTYGAWTTPAEFDPLIEAFYFANVTMALVTLAYLAGQLSQLRGDEKSHRYALKELMERLQVVATQDELTGLPNRRHVLEWLPQEVARARRGAAPLCVAILDLDRFKQVNDTYGHAAGDDVLRLFAREARTVLREGDVLARWGGEEFLLVMPRTTLDEALAAIERIRARLALPVLWATSPCGRVTFSAGATRYRPTDTFEEALRSADLGLYEAKAQGRDRTVAVGRDDPVLATPPHVAVAA